MKKYITTFALVACVLFALTPRHGDAALRTSQTALGGIYTTAGIASATDTYVIARNTSAVINLTTLVWDGASKMGFNQTLIGVQNIGGTVTTQNIPSNLLTSGFLSTALLGCSISVAGDTNDHLIVTYTGVSGLTLTWGSQAVYRVTLNPSLTP